MTHHQRNSLATESLRRCVALEVASSGLVAPAKEFKGLRFILDPLLVFGALFSRSQVYGSRRIAVDVVVLNGENVLIPPT